MAQNLSAAELHALCDHDHEIATTLLPIQTVGVQGVLMFFVSYSDTLLIPLIIP